MSSTIQYTTSQLCRRIKSLFSEYGITEDSRFAERIIKNKKNYIIDSLWFRRIYYYDNNRSLVFYHRVGEKNYFYDCCGNFYPNENHFLLSLKNIQTYHHSDDKTVRSIDDIKNKCDYLCKDNFERFCIGLQILHGDQGPKMLKNLLKIYGETELQDKIFNSVKSINLFFDVLIQNSKADFIINESSHDIMIGPYRFEIEDLNTHKDFLRFEQEMASSHKDSPERYTYVCNEVIKNLRNKYSDFCTDNFLKEYKYNVNNSFKNPALAEECHKIAYKMLEKMKNVNARYLDHFQHVVNFLESICVADFVKNNGFFKTVTDEQITKWSEQFELVYRIVETERDSQINNQEKLHVIKSCSTVCHFFKHYDEIREAHEKIKKCHHLPEPDILKNFKSAELPNIKSVKNFNRDDIKDAVEYYLKTIPGFVLNDNLYTELTKDHGYYTEPGNCTGTKTIKKYYADRFAAVTHKHITEEFSSISTIYKKI